MYCKTLSLWAIAASLLSVQALPKVTRSGRYLYTDDGTRFYIKGIAYQEQGAVVPGNGNAFLEPSSFFDPLADQNACNRDVVQLKALGVNTIRVYNVNSTLNHDACMQTLSAANIYTIIDLGLPLNGSIARDAPTWSTNLLNQYTNTIDVFSKYDNVLAYNVGNEVVTSNITDIAPYVKAAARDIRTYLQAKQLTTLIGYAAIDGTSNFRLALAEYLSCDISGQNKDDTSIDIYGLNNYEWCGDASINSYSGVNSDYADYNVAAYFSEFGCITQTRLWTEVQALFGSDMSQIWSGGIAFSYFPDASAAGQFGMVTISSDGSSVSVSDDFTRLQAQYGNVTFINSPSKGSSQESYPSCPANNANFNAVTKLPPTPNAGACNCLEDNLSCRFTPQTSNYSAIVGDLLNQGCSFLGQDGTSCDDIASGTDGTYGRLSGCDPTIKLSWVMSKHYEFSKKDPQACSFGGNGTVNPLATASADAAASSCISNPSATFTPPTTTSGSSKQTGHPGNGAVSLVGSTNASLGLGVMCVLGLFSGIWTLA